MRGHSAHILANSGIPLRLYSRIHQPWHIPNQGLFYLQTTSGGARARGLLRPKYQPGNIFPGEGEISIHGMGW